MASVTCMACQFPASILRHGLGCLERRADDLSPMRGLVFGCLFGAVIWFALILIALSLWR